MEQVQPGQEEQSLEGEAQPAEQERLSLEAAVTEGTGPFAAIRTGLSNLWGPLQKGEVYPDTASARQKVRTFNQFAKSGHILNPKKV